MKVYIDGKEILCLNDVVVVHENQIVAYKGIKDEEIMGQLHVKCTHEGMILDMIEDGADDIDRTAALDFDDLKNLCY